MTIDESIKPLVMRLPMSTVVKSSSSCVIMLSDIKDDEVILLSVPRKVLLSIEKDSPTIFDGTEYRSVDTVLP